MDEFLTVPEAGKLLRLSKDTMYRLMRHADPDERIPSFKVGGTRRIRRAELERWIKEREQQRA
jgi:excisionase family DNA binding protein